jgi:hypothetical protein
VELADQNLAKRAVALASELSAARSR